MSNDWLLAKQLGILRPEKGVCNTRGKLIGGLPQLAQGQIQDSVELCKWEVTGSQVKTQHLISWVSSRPELSAGATPSDLTWEEITVTQ